MRRRAFLRTAGAGSVLALAGCAEDESPPASVTLGATREFVGSTPEVEVAGTWLAEEFRARTEHPLVWQTPPGALSKYVARRLQGRPLGADGFLGVTPDALAAARNRTPDIFDALSVGDPPIDLYGFDPRGHVVPVVASNVCVVYDETRIEAPETFDALLAPEHAGDLLVPDPRTDTLGRWFYLWSIHHFGFDAARERWRAFLRADDTLYASSAAARAAYREDAAPMLVTSATTTLFAARHQLPLERYRVRFPDDTTYRHVAGVGLFADAANPGLVREFASFLLDPEVQGRLAVLTGALPVTPDADLPEDFYEYVTHPERTISHGYDALDENLDDWLAGWQRTLTAART